ncbi:urease accessory protein UreH domain-containing protein [Mycobacteroides abscessus]|uniref:urease accessory protein UreH domain-containing protein n=1 Tax=Mycobacteroides abscessus TaxID=36809 RepID=UPI0005E22A2F|nr:sulfite exporter TauE/SafE family protein [Mycobacteroides abscessus]MBE5510518.1 hypothetical protein [Mycobacteroides abscessus]MDB2192882.1 sulfite exporter TauE/SafE family protein [Mycobacteroides abscessus subsp. abscessus]MDM2471919.1 sulfite exporter TauE/SafE family protein [Mycobacteroides abscessus]MDM2477625.1 sulfite exporter TauE/SafE family protein [Mycobacteroides abscessus]MDM2481784.1 sulfite exporter TauE/SafE family protein [Mycobacteroides abscessus]
MDLIAVLLTGLFAGGISCAAVQGGLLTGLIARQRGQSVPPPATGDRGRWHRFCDDMAPVAGFLAGKLTSHAVLGALLGALGAAAQLSVGTRTWLQLGAGVLIVALGFAQLGVPGFRRIVIEPPASFSRIVRARTRSQAVFAPAVLGMATVLIPCGVTLSVEALALASGSAARGALVMAVFVLGTSPLFAALGYAARKLATAWRGRLAVATGVVIVVMGVATINGGLELAGSPWAASRLGQTLDLVSPVADASSVTVRDGHQEIVVRASAAGYTPRNITVQHGMPTTLVVRADEAAGCIRSFVIPSRQEERTLPVSGDVRIDLGVLTPGVLPFACGMGMYSGQLSIT